MLRVPLPAALARCADLCAPPQASDAARYYGLRVQYTGASGGAYNFVHRYNDFDDLHITPTANTFCNTTDVATVSNLAIAGVSVQADVTTAGSTSTVTLPYTFSPPLDMTIDMSQTDAQNHVATDTWTLSCGGNSSGYVIFSFESAPSVCSLILTPFI